MTARRDLDEDYPHGDPGAATCRHCGQGRRLIGPNRGPGTRVLVCDTCDPDPLPELVGRHCPDCECYEPDPTREVCHICGNSLTPPQAA